jgi:hypothetical protein
MKTLRSRTTRENYEELLQNGKVDYSEVDWEAWNYAKYVRTTPHPPLTAHHSPTFE